MGAVEGSGVEISMGVASAGGKQAVGVVELVYDELNLAVRTRTHYISSSSEGVIHSTSN